MKTTADRLNSLLDIKSNIKNAIISKGVEVNDSDTFNSYAEKIMSIELSTGGDSDIEDAIVTRTITIYSNERIKSVGSQAFMNSSSLQSVNLPNVVTVGISSFNNCTSLVDVNMPKLETISTQTFYGCNSLMFLKLPSLKTLSTQSCRNCKKLEIVDLSSATDISVLSLDGCTALKCLIIRTDTRCSLAATSAFGGTLIASGTGYIYVPRSLVDSYKSASYWSTYESQFRVLEDYTVDGTTTGDIDKTKI